MKYREFLDLTNDEILFILNDIFHPKRIENINRDKEWNQIDVDMTTEWGKADDEDGIIEITDNIILSMDDIKVDFQMANGDMTKWKQFLLAKGCNYLLKDNPYLEDVVSS